MTISTTPTANLLDRITIDPSICHGKPILRGLRYPVEGILEYLGGGDTFEEMLAEFPDLEMEDLQACIQFARSPMETGVGKNGKPRTESDETDV
jgi:uncharacterized protein (DUF433 family)